MMVALTFDDGYLDHFYVAQYLYSKGIPATFFVVTGLSYYQGQPLLTIKPGLLGIMRDMGHEITSHLHTHRDLAKLDSIK